MQHYHAVVWLDHREAKVFFFDRYNVAEIDLAAAHPNAHLHHHAGSLSGKRAPEDQAYFRRIADVLRPATEWLVVGPGLAKLEFIKYVHKHEHQLDDRILGVETADHPTDRQIVAHARTYFRAADRMRPQA